MPEEKYSKGYFEYQFVPELKEKLRQAGMNTDFVPNYETIRHLGHEPRSLNNALQRHFDDDMTVRKYLKNNGFRELESTWSSQHEGTVRRLEEYREKQEIRTDYGESWFITLSSAINKFLKIRKRKHQSDNLIELGKASTEDEKKQRNREAQEILDEMVMELSGGSFHKYFKKISEVFDYLEINGIVDHNPIGALSEEYNKDTTPSTSPEQLSEDQIKRLWKTLQQLSEETNPHKAIEGLLIRHGQYLWQMQMMALLILYIGLGVRPAEPTIMNAKTDWKFSGTPQIHFPYRKNDTSNNDPNQLPILTHPQFLKNFKQVMQIYIDDWNGKVAPSENSATGSRDPDTLNYWFKSLCKASNVRLSDGQLPTLQNLRQTWHNHYIDALRKHDVHLKIVAETQGTKNHNIITESYQSHDKEGESIKKQELESQLSPEELWEREDLDNGEKADLENILQTHFEKIMPVNTYPPLMAKTLDKHGEDYQTKLSKFT